MMHSRWRHSRSPSRPQAAARSLNRLRSQPSAEPRSRGSSPDTPQEARSSRSRSPSSPLPPLRLRSSSTSRRQENARAQARRSPSPSPQRPSRTLGRYGSCHEQPGVSSSLCDTPRVSLRSSGYTYTYAGASYSEAPTLAPSPKTTTTLPEQTTHPKMRRLRMRLMWDPELSLWRPPQL